jgi:CheY-like chemotaxis protein
MELVAGRDLRELLADGPIGVSRAARLLRQVADACGAAHAAGIVHRDLKPENVMVQADDTAVVLDLGLSVEVWKPSETPVGIILGTPLYMAPERFEAAGADARGDVYALGVMAFEMLAGRPPFQGGSLVELAVTRRDNPADPSALREKSVPRGLVEVVMRCLERSPEARFENGRELSAALAAWLKQPQVDLAATHELPALDAPAVVLTVDDDPLIRGILRVLLEPLGCEVLESASGEAALQVLTSRTVDLILLDIVMPGMDGFDVLQVVRSTPAISRTPVVLVSARSDRERRAFAQQKGANGFLEKPIDADNLKQVVGNWLVG